MMATVRNCPVYDGDVFSDDALRHPFEHYRAIRALGAVVQLRGHDFYALSRFDDVQTALRRPETLISGRGVGLNDIINAPVPEPTVIHSDGERHRRLRINIARPLMPAALREHRAMLKGLIETQVRECVGIGTFDGVERLARYLPVAAISYLVGLPEEGRQNMLRWAAAQFNMQGPYSPQLDEAVSIFRESRAYLTSFDPKQLRQGSWADGLFKLVEKGKLTEGEARAAVSGYVLPSLDTTISAKSHLIYNLGRFQEEWVRLRREPQLIPSAVMEGMRFNSVVRYFSRFAQTDYQNGDVAIPAGSRVVLMYAAANRDERHYPYPDRFDIARNPQDHLGWGTGSHMCAGMHLAKLEMEVLLEALVENVSAIEVDEARFGSNKGLYGVEALPMRLLS
jgi:cytochrome P450